MLKVHERYLKVHEQILMIHERHLQVHEQMPKVHERYLKVRKQILKVYERYLKVCERYLLLRNKPVHFLQIVIPMLMLAQCGSTSRQTQDVNT